MGNALNFQAKFTNIAQNTENQDYQGVFLEYGDLVHIVWDFEPLEDASLEGIEQYVAQFVQDNDFLGRTEIEKYMIASGLTGISRLIKENEDIVTERLAQKWEEDKARNAHPTVEWGAPYDGLQSTLDIGYGFLNGMVDVFPATSLP